MNKNTIYIIVAVLVVVIIIAGVAVYLYSGKGGSTSATPTPTPAPTVVPVGSATSLQFAVNATKGGTTTTLQFAGENIGTSNLTIRIDLPANKLSYVLKYGTQQSWSSTDSGSTWTLDSSFTNDNNIWGARWLGEISSLGNWTGTGNYQYTDTTTNPSTSVTIYNISVNPALPASLFATS